MLKDISRAFCRMCFWGSLLLAPLFYYWTVETSGASIRINGHQGDYYNLLVDGFLDGHLYMKAKVDPQLQALPPAERPGAAPYLLDASLFNGRYYLYFGVTPALSLFLPFTLLTGHDLPESLGCLTFMLLGLALAVAWWRYVQLKFFRRLGSIWVVLGFLALGFCTVAPSALRRPMFYEAAIGAGYASMMFALWALLLAIYKLKARFWWLVLAGVGVGLAVGSRANLVPGGVVLLIFGCSIIPYVSSDRLVGYVRRTLLLCILATGIGAGAIAIGLASYNYARFGKITEFGHNHQIGQNPKKMFRAENFAHNFHLYYLKPPVSNGFFPFVAPAEEGPKPTDYIGREHVHGEWIWTLVLVVLVVIALVFYMKNQRFRTHRNWILIFGLPLVLFFVNGTILGLSGVRSNRYMLDFHPALVLGTLVLYAAVISMLIQWGRQLWLLYIVVSLILCSIIFNIFASMQVHGFYAVNSPISYDRMAHFFDRLMWPLMYSEHSEVGDKELKLRWPAGVNGFVREPLLSIGTKDFYDILWIDYDGPNRARFVYRHGEYSEVLGRWFNYNASERAKVLVSGAFLLPSISHPWYDERPLAERIARKRHLRVLVNDEAVLDRDVLSYDSSPRLQHWGEAILAGGQGAKFRGDIQRTLTLPTDDWWNRRNNSEGSVKFRIELPTNRYGATEPLLQMGGRAGFDSLSITYLRDGWVQLVHDQLGGGARVSGPFAVDYNQIHSLEIESPNLSDNLFWTERGPIDVDKSPANIRVNWNGRQVFAPELPPYPASRESIALGVNWWNSSSSFAFFTGFLEESPALKPTSEIQPGVLDWIFNSVDTLADLRGIIAQFSRTDGEKATLVWRRSYPGGRLTLGWMEGGVTAWSAEHDDSVKPMTALRLQITKASWTGTETSPGWIELESGGQILISQQTTFFARGQVQARALLSERWLGSALVPASESVVQSKAKSPSSDLPGRLRLRFALPQNGYVGSDPLFSVGTPGAADSIYLRGLGQGRYVLGIDHWSVGANESTPFILDASAVHSLLIELGSLAAAGEFKPDHVRLILNEKVVLEVKVSLFPVKPETITYGLNPHGMSTSAAAFRGSIISVRAHEPLPANFSP